ncbi:hypothetical protein BCR44DRAFT_53441 [Catenaria anguillulae PL171]|uniref:Protein disulfide-isomerase n=1 Tax=Catenaria anguillulae PL171 TaxID=765915 RepID=A0A1Y2H6T7_9FUNG|nr:hypothetical protein BCR44DRAFT_53441 [Catenaria anguillulae PL171]
MKLTHFSLLAASALAVFARAESADTATDASDVLVLGGSDFKDVVNPEKLMLVEFYAPWCGHCKQLAPEYEKAATTLKAESIKLGKVDCTEHRELCDSFQVQGFPTMKVFREGKAYDYNGGRTEDTIVKYMRKQSLPAFSQLKAAGIADFAKKDRLAVIAYLPKGKDSAEFKAIEQLANQHRDDFLFGYSTEAAAAKDMGAKDTDKPALAVYRQFDEPKVLFDGSLADEAAMAAFIKRESIPTMDEVTPENYMTYVNSGVPLAFFFYDTPETRNKYGPGIEKVARKYKKSMHFVYCDAGKYGAHADTLALKSNTWPAFAINEVEQGLKWPFDQTVEPTEDKIAEFVTKYINKEIDPTLKSEEPPKDAEKADVYQVVGKTFKEVVLNKNKDVFIEFYAPWCGHCKKLAPTFESLGKLFKDQADKVTIAKLDLTENDLPPNSGDRVEGFPTLRLYKAKDNAVVEYNGDRSLEDLVSFIGKNAANKIKVPEVPKEDKKEGEAKKDAEGKKEGEAERDEL